MKCFSKSLISASIIVSLVANFCVIPCSFAEVSSLPSPKKIELASLKIPNPIGTIQETYEGKSDKTILIIQDAHSNPSAQKSIKKMIKFFENKYRLSLIGLEGAAKRLNPDFLKNYPDAESLKKILHQYMDKGELSGVSAAALEGERYVHYEGIENWDDYLKGEAFFKEALKQEKKLFPKIEKLKVEIEGDKKKAYSKELYDLDKQIDSFYQHPTNIEKILNTLQRIQPPSSDSQLQVIIKHLNFKEQEDEEARPEINTKIEELKFFLARESDLQNKRKIQINFQEKLQAFQTQQISAGEFALFLQSEMTPYFPMNFSKPTLRLINHQKMLSNIEGTKLLEEFAVYSENVKERLMTTPQQRGLNQKAQKLRLLEKWMKLELNRNEWKRVKGSLRRNEILAKNFTVDDFKAQKAFYENAERRELNMVYNLVQKMKKLHQNQAVLVIGGFHASGVENLLKKENISYCLIAPTISKIPEVNIYKNQMNGEISWSKYFISNKGNVDLYAAFMRFTRDQLLLNVEPAQKIEILKEWRDNIIRYLALTNQIQNTNHLLMFIDEALKRESNENFFSPKRKKKDLFIQDLRKLYLEKQLNSQSFLTLLSPSSSGIAIADIASQLAQGSNKPDSLYRELNTEEPAFKKDRSELRAEVQFNPGGKWNFNSPMEVALPEVKLSIPDGTIHDIKTFIKGSDVRILILKDGNLTNTLQFKIPENSPLEISLGREHFTDSPKVISRAHLKWTITKNQNGEYDVTFKNTGKRDITQIEGVEGILSANFEKKFKFKVGSPLAFLMLGQRLALCLETKNSELTIEGKEIDSELQLVENGFSVTKKVDLSDIKDGAEKVISLSRRANSKDLDKLINYRFDHVSRNQANLIIKKTSSGYSFFIQVLPSSTKTLHWVNEEWVTISANGRYLLQTVDETEKPKAEALVGIVPLNHLKSQGSKQMLEYSPDQDKVVPFSYTVAHLDSSVPTGDQRIYEAQKKFDLFEDANYEVLNILMAPGLTFLQYQKAEEVLRKMLELYLELYSETSSTNLKMFECVAAAKQALESILGQIKAELKPFGLKPNELVPERILKKMTKIDESITKRLIALPYKGDYGGVEKLSFHEFINFLHQKGIRNRDILIETYNAKKRAVKVKIINHQTNQEQGHDLSYVDARTSPNQNIPLPVQHIGLAFSRGQMIHGNSVFFNSNKALIFSDEFQAGMQMPLGVHSVRVKYTFQPTQERGRIVINYQDSGPQYRGSIFRLAMVEKCLTELGFKVFREEGSYRLDAYYDKDSASSHDMSEMPEKLGDAIQLLISIKDLDLSFSNEQQALETAEQFLRQGYLWRPSGTRTPKALNISESVLGKIVSHEQSLGLGVDIENQNGQKRLTELSKRFQKLSDRNALEPALDVNYSIKTAYATASKESPAKTFLQFIENKKGDELLPYKKIAAIAKAAEFYGETKIIDSVGGYNVLRLKLHTLEDNVTFYVLKDAMTGEFCLAYAVLGDFFYNETRYDRFRNKTLSSNLLSLQDLAEILIPHHMASGEALQKWLEELDLETEKSKTKNIFDFLEDENFAKIALPKFDVDLLKIGTVRGAISSIAVGGTPISPGRVIARILKKNKGLPDSYYEGEIFLAESAEVEDDSKMQRAAGIVVTTGGPNAHAAIQARQIGIPAIIADAKLGEVGIEFDYLQGKSSRRVEQGFEGMAISMLGGHSDLSRHRADIQNGDLVYLDASNGMLYLLVGAGEKAEQGLFDQYQSWKKKNDRTVNELEKIISSITKENLFRAIIDEILSEKLISNDELTNILDNKSGFKQEILQVLKARKLKTAKVYFRKELAVIKETTTSNVKDSLLALYLSLDILRHQKEVIESISKEDAVESNEAWQEALRQISNYRSKYQSQLKGRILKHFELPDINGFLARNSPLSEDQASDYLSATSRLLENAKLADFDKLSEEITRLNKLKKQLEDLRKKQLEDLAQIGDVLTKDELRGIEARFIAGGKASNSALLGKALKTYADIYGEGAKYRVKNPNGAAVLEPTYKQFRATNEIPERAKLNIGFAYRGLVNDQRKEIFDLLTKDQSLPKQFKEIFIESFGVDISAITDLKALDLIIVQWRSLINLAFLQSMFIEPNLSYKLAVFGSVAVRSSGVKEDSIDDAMAGQKTTVLNVTGREEIYEAVKAVWRSAAEAVLIDSMTNPEKAILIFSVDASTQKPRMRVSAALGLTQGLVDTKDGVKDPDSFVMEWSSKDKGYKVTERKIGKKAEAARLKPTKGGGVELVPTAPKEAAKPALNNEQLIFAAGVANFLAGYFGYPLDIEGAFSGDEFLIYQVRPISTLKAVLERSKSALRSEVRQVPVGALAHVVETLNNGALVVTNEDASDLVSYIELNGEEAIKTIASALNEVIDHRLWSQGIQDLIDTLLPTQGTIALVLPNQTQSSILKRLVDILKRSNIKNVKLVGENGAVLNDYAQAVRKSGSHVEPVKKLSNSQRKIGIIPTAVLKSIDSVQLPANFLPFWIKDEVHRNVLVREYAEIFLLVSLIHTARLVELDPDLANDHLKLKAELNKALRISEETASILSGEQVNGLSGFSISSVAVNILLAARSEARIQQSA